MSDTLLASGAGLLLLIAFLSWLFEIPHRAYPSDDSYVTDDDA